MRNWFSKNTAQEVAQKESVEPSDESKQITDSRWSTYSNFIRKRFSKSEAKIEKEPTIEEPKVISKVQKGKLLAKHYFGLLCIQLLAVKNLLLGFVESSRAAVQSASKQSAAKVRSIFSRKMPVENISPKEATTVKTPEKKPEAAPKVETIESKKTGFTLSTLVPNLKFGKVKNEPEPEKPATRKEIIQTKLITATIKVKYVLGLMVTQLVLLRNLFLELLNKSKDAVQTQTKAVLDSQFISKVKSLMEKKQFSKVVQKPDQQQNNFMKNVLKYCGVRL